MAKERRRPEGNVQTLPAAPVETAAPVCPRNSAHTATRVYRTEGRLLFCVCDDCGDLWKEKAPAAEEGGS
ncbi:MAG TPA: hypothetical protein VG826_29170 [Pirellulales bacterium]|nr:hypothetical protein [Pirellulales bacterium]